MIPEHIPPDQTFWNTHWEKDEIGWDIGHASQAITTYLAQYGNKQAAILIPGCGNAYEAEYLVANGFTDITLIDIAPAAVKRLQEKFANTPQVNVRCGDFFLHQACTERSRSGVYDLIIEANVLLCHSTRPPKRIRGKSCGIAQRKRQGNRAAV